MNRKQATLSPAEWEVMRVIWKRKEVIVRDVYDELREDEGWAQTTVRTMMERLVRKGFLRQKRVGPVCVYRPAIAYEKALSRTLRDVAERATGGDLSTLVSYAIEAGDMSEEELAEIETRIRKRKKRQR